MEFHDTFFGRSEIGTYDMSGCHRGKHITVNKIHQNKSKLKLCFQQYNGSLYHKCLRHFSSICKNKLTKVIVRKFVRITSKPNFHSTENGTNLLHTKNLTIYQYTQTISTKNSLPFQERNQPLVYFVFATSSSESSNNPAQCLYPANSSFYRVVLLMYLDRVSRCYREHVWNVSSSVCLCVVFWFWFQERKRNPPKYDSFAFIQVWMTSSQQ